MGAPVRDLHVSVERELAALRRQAVRRRSALERVALGGLLFAVLAATAAAQPTDAQGPVDNAYIVAPYSHELTATAMDTDPVGKSVIAARCGDADGCGLLIANFPDGDPLPNARKTARLFTDATGSDWRVFLSSSDVFVSGSTDDESNEIILAAGDAAESCWLADEATFDSYIVVANPDSDPERDSLTCRLRIED